MNSSRPIPTTLLLVTLVLVGAGGLWLSRTSPRAAEYASLELEPARAPQAFEQGSTQLKATEGRSAAVEPRPESRPAADPAPPLVPLRTDRPLLIGHVLDTEGLPVFGAVVELQFHEGFHAVTVARSGVGSNGGFTLPFDTRRAHRKMEYRRYEWSDELEDELEGMDAGELKHLLDRFVPMRPGEKSLKDSLKLVGLEDELSRFQRDLLRTALRHEEKPAGVEGYGYRLRAFALGYRTASVDLPSRINPPWPRRFDLTLVPGATIEGQVLCSIGPASNATVLFMRHNLELLQETRTDAHGRYEINFTGEGEYLIHARSELWGTATHERLRLSDSAPVDLPPVMLAGQGFLTGHVVDMSGSAVENITLELVPEQYGSSNRTIPFTELVQAELAGGLYNSHMTTDEFGRFVFSGLLKERFTYRFSQLSPERQPDRVDLPSQQGFALIFEGHRLCVSIVSDGGSDLLGALVSISELDPNGKPRKRRQIRAESGSIVVPVEPDRTYVIEAHASGFCSDETRVVISRARPVSNAELFLLDETNPLAGFGRPGHGIRPVGRHQGGNDGIVKVEVVTAQGETVTGYRVRLEEYSSRRIPRGFASVVPGENGFLRNIPRDTYTVMLLPTPESFPVMSEILISTGVNAIPRERSSDPIELDTSATLVVRLPTHAETGARLSIMRRGTGAWRGEFDLDLDERDTSGILTLHLVPGSYTLNWRARSGARLAQHTLELLGDDQHMAEFAGN